MVGKDENGSDDDGVPTIQELIRASGVNPTQIAKAMGRTGRQQIYELRDGKVSAFPKASTFEPLAQALGVDITTVVLAFAKTLGLPVTRHGARLTSYLPADTELLSDQQVDAVVAVIKAMLPPAGDRAGTVTPIKAAPASAPRVARSARAARKPSTPRQRDVDET